MGSCQSAPRQVANPGEARPGVAGQPHRHGGAGAPGLPTQPVDRRRQQELEDEAFARRLVMEELAGLGAGGRSFRPGAASQGAAGAATAGSRALAGGARAVWAVCPYCETQNEVTASAVPVVMRCGSCSGQFQVALPSSMEGMGQGTGTSFQLCRRCGAMNQFPTPNAGQPMPNVLCGFCGHVAPATSRLRRGGLHNMESRLAERSLVELPPGFSHLHASGGPMVRINVGGQRRVVPLMLLLALMAEEAETGNPAQAADIEALPTRKLAGSENIGEQSKCLICLEEFGDGDDIKTLPCLHIYHQKCVEQWLRTDNSCPVCKTPIGHAAGLQ